MKKIIAIATLMVTVSASAGMLLRSHYGLLSLNGKYECTYTNNTDSNLDFKWVIFNLERRAGRTNEFVKRKKVDAIVYPGESITVSSGETARYIGRSCKFLAR